jgi:hypothetical protein
VGPVADPQKNPLGVHSRRCDDSIARWGNGEVLWRVAADVVLGVHLALVAFVVFGGFLTWRWPRIALVQLPVALYGVTIEIVGFRCPLTPLEKWLRRRAGSAGYDGGFVEHYIVGVLYPGEFTGGRQGTPSVRGGHCQRLGLPRTQEAQAQLSSLDAGDDGFVSPYEGLTSVRRSVPQGDGRTYQMTIGRPSTGHSGRSAFRGYGTLRRCLT